MAINWTSITTPADLLSAPNTNTSGGFWVTTLYLFWVVLLIVFSGFGFEASILVSSFLALVVSIFLLYMGLIQIGFMLFFVGILLFYIIYIVWSTNK